MKRGLFVLLVVAVLGVMQGWNISRAQTPDDENACELRQFYSEVAMSSNLYTVTPEEQKMFPPEGGGITYVMRGPIGTAWRVVTNNYWSYPSNSSGTIYHDIVPSTVWLYAMPNDSIGNYHRTGVAYFIFTNNFGFSDTLRRLYWQPNAHVNDY
ncbi:MAG TPA: hypothetical protein IAA13_08145 [Candidatus Alistipes merdigallinarum]|nr:hypothetical protein [Candidatus Alistipes merdigallinarum]